MYTVICTQAISSQLVWSVGILLQSVLLKRLDRTTGAIIRSGRSQLKFHLERYLFSFFPAVALQKSNNWARETFARRTGAIRKIRRCNQKKWARAWHTYRLMRDQDMSSVLQWTNARWPLSNKTASSPTARRLLFGNNSVTCLQSQFSATQLQLRCSTSISGQQESSPCSELFAKNMLKFCVRYRNTGISSKSRASYFPSKKRKSKAVRRSLKNEKRLDWLAKGFPVPLRRSIVDVLGLSLGRCRVFFPICRGWFFFFLFNLLPLNRSFLPSAKFASFLA